MNFQLHKFDSKYPTVQLYFFFLAVFGSPSEESGQEGDKTHEPDMAGKEEQDQGQQEKEDKVEQEREDKAQEGNITCNHLTVEGRKVGNFNLSFRAFLFVNEHSVT